VSNAVPLHCGIQGNGEANKLAKQGAEKPQTNSSVSLPEINIMIKSIYITSCSSENYHQRSMQEQLIFCLQTGHNRLIAYEQTLSARFIPPLFLWRG
jgi:hypothetical protein